jgi:hypothetical protein
MTQAEMDKFNAIKEKLAEMQKRAADLDFK